MAHLHDLPEDLIILILQYIQLRAPTDIGYRPLRTNLVRFCLVSRSFVPTTQRALYSSFWCDRQRETWRIRAFLRTVIANPLLASYVLGLDLVAWRAWDRDSDEWDDNTGNDRYDDDRKYSPVQNRSDRKLFHQAIHHLALSDKTFWRSAVRKDVDEVYVALLALLLPNLRKLNLSLPLKFTILEKALDHATLLRSLHAPFASLQKVEDVSSWFRGNVAQGDIHELAPFFRLPCVKRIRAGNQLVSSKPWPQLPQQTTLQKLKLECRDIQPEVLGSMLSGLGNLRVFDFNSSPHASEIMFPSNFLVHPQRFGSALLNAAASLREIYISYSTHYHSDGTLLGSFRSFTRLKSLTTELRWLLGDARSVQLVDILPPSLEKLALTAGEWDGYFGLDALSPVTRGLVVSQFKELVDAKPSVMTNLRSIGDVDSQTARQISGFDELLDACRRQDVTLE
ncbi:MAG: hypothetical protein LQ337_005796 [Flavoplaca oasis]|nr:MAG: hypothetical protein LQ337_005796 [Flavoplaca oasis]